MANQNMPGGPANAATPLICSTTSFEECQHVSLLETRLRIPISPSLAHFIAKLREHHSGIAGLLAGPITSRIADALAEAHAIPRLII